MFVLKNKLTVGFLIIVYKSKKKNEWNLIMLLFHNLSQILDQNNNN